MTSSFKKSSLLNDISSIFSEFKCNFIKTEDTFVKNEYSVI